MPIMEAESFAALYDWKLLLVYISICLLNCVFFGEVFARLSAVRL